jgi:hypothetical protein
VLLRLICWGDGKYNEEEFRDCTAQWIILSGDIDKTIYVNKSQN